MPYAEQVEGSVLRRKNRGGREIEAANSSAGQATLSPEDEREIYQNSVRLVRAEPGLNLAAEYNSLKDAINEYKQTPGYLNPTTDQDEAWKNMVDGADQLNEERLRAFMKEKRFALAAKRIAEDLPTINNASREILFGSQTTGESPDHGGLNLAEGKSDLLQGTGIAMTVVGALGAFSGLKDIGKAGMITSEARSNKLRTKGRYKVLFSAWPLIVGALIISQSDPNQDTVKAAQAWLATGAATSGLIAVAGLVAFVAANPIARTAVTDEVRQKISAQPMSNVSGQPQKAMSPSDVEAKVKVEMGTPNAQKAVEANKGVLRAGGALTFILFGGLAAGQAIWADKLNLASQEMSHKDKLASKMGRALIAFEEIEKRGEF